MVRDVYPDRGRFSNCGGRAPKRGSAAVTTGWGL
jgi:hypothetical protein